MKQVPELIVDRYLRYWASTDPYFSEYNQPEEAPEAPSTSANPFTVLPVEPTEEQSPIDVEPTEEVTTDVDSDHSSTPTSRHQSLELSRAPSPVTHHNIESQAATPVSPVSPTAPVAHAPTPVYHIPIVAQLQPPANMSAQASTTITGTQAAAPAAPPTTGANGSLKGNVPKPFTRECSESTKFLLTFKIFWASNRNNP